jgi:NAD(P)-dependent dehydrogenase (short-subunit alcohol dehydrogenase family)
MRRLAGTVVIITDAASDIGAETARLFISEGATVITGGRMQERCQGARCVGDSLHDGGRGRNIKHRRWMVLF